MKENSLVLYRIRSSAILLRWVEHKEAQNRNSAGKNADTLSKKKKGKTSQDSIHTDICLPTKSLWPVASMLFRLMSLKFNSADPGGENKKPTVIMKLYRWAELTWKIIDRPLCSSSLSMSNGVPAIAPLQPQALLLNGSIQSASLSLALTYTCIHEYIHAFKLITIRAATPTNPTLM